MFWLLLTVALQTPPPPAAPLASSTTPASVALLVERVAEQDTRRSIVEALRHHDPRVRVVAARATFVTGLAVAPQLREALRAESDGEAAKEQIRSLLPIADPSTHREMLQHAARLGQSAFAVSTLARMRGAVVLDLLPEGPPPEGALLAAAEVLRDHPIEVRARIGEMALASDDAAAWTVILEGTVAPEVLAKGVAASSGAIRGATYAHLLGLPTLPEAPVLREVLESRVEASGTPPQNRVAYLRDLLRRKVDPQHVVDSGWPVRLDGVFLGESSRRFEGLMTPEERSALGLERRETPLPDPTPDPKVPRIRTIGDLPTGLLAELMAATKCRTNGRTVAIAEIGYDRLSRPVRVRIGASSGSPACERAMKAALALDTARRPGDGPTAEVVVVRLDEGIPSCSESPVKAKPATTARVGGRIMEPKKIKQVPPIYPRLAREKEIQGTVILEAQIDSGGCVSHVELAKSANVHLDMEAVLTVAAWRYSPTLLNGKPVPVLMTVTVNFKLN